MNEVNDLLLLILENHELLIPLLIEVSGKSYPCIELILNNIHSQ